VVALVLVFGLIPSPRATLAQQAGLRSRFGQLFTFGTGCGPEVLFCLRSGSGTPDFAQQAFSSNANATARELTRYLQGAIALGIATTPVPSAGSGETFRLSALGVPVRNEENSLGPILAERALTLGRGKFLVGANVTELSFESLRGVSLQALLFNVVQRDLPPFGPPLGDPAIERTYLSVATRMAFQARVATVFLTAGISERLDLSLLLPVVQASLSGFSDATIVIGEGEDPAAGFSFGGPTEDPQLQERAVLPLQKTIGLGDALVRGKLRLTSTENQVALAVLSDVRIPTGKDEGFLGSGGWWIQALGVASARPLARLTPHLNAGGVYRTGQGERSALLGTLGVDYRWSARVTVAGELLGEAPLGDNPLVRRVVTLQDAFGGLHEIPTSNLPTLNDARLDGALGLKLQLWRVALVGNILVPLNQGGLRGDVLWTLGLQGGF
jgi:hypothetical protein